MPPPTDDGKVAMWDTLPTVFTENVHGYTLASGGPQAARGDGLKGGNVLYGSQGCRRRVDSNFNEFFRTLTIFYRLPPKTILNALESTSGNAAQATVQ